MLIFYQYNLQIGNEHHLLLNIQYSIFQSFQKILKINHNVFSVSKLHCNCDRIVRTMARQNRCFRFESCRGAQIFLILLWFFFSNNYLGIYFIYHLSLVCIYSVYSFTFLYGCSIFYPVIYVHSFLYKIMSNCQSLAFFSLWTIRVFNYLPKSLKHVTKGIFCFNCIL